MFCIGMNIIFAVVFCCYGLFLIFLHGDVMNYISCYAMLDRFQRK